jgi:hypothetical protein
VNIAPSHALLQRLRAYAEPFAKSPPALLRGFAGGDSSGFPFAPESDRGLGVMLLAASLYRPGGGEETARLLTGLHARFGNDLFRLNRISFDILREAVDALSPELDAQERKQVPGTLRSVCDFFYRAGPLTAWLAPPADWETRLGELCGEIHRMGLHSRTRTRGRWFFWLMSHQPGFAARYPQAMTFRWPVSAGHMRFVYDIVKPARTRTLPSPERRLDLFAELATAAFPGEPWKLFAPLDAFLDPAAGGTFRCREVQGGCRRCALSTECPAARNFLATESPAGE